MTTWATPRATGRRSQRWLTVVAVRNVASIRTGEPARQEAGGFLLQLLQTLPGWRPSPEHGPLVRIAAPRPGYDRGLGYFPLAFHTLVDTEGATP